MTLGALGDRLEDPGWNLSSGRFRCSSGQGLVLDVAALVLALGRGDHRLVVEVGIICALGDARG